LPSAFCIAADAAHARGLRQDPSQAANEGFTGELVVPEDATITTADLSPSPSPSPSLSPNDTALASPSPNDTSASAGRKLLQFDDAGNFTEGNATTNFTGADFQDDFGNFTTNATTNFTGVEFQDDFGNFTTNATTNFTGAEFQDDFSGNFTETNATTNFTGTDFTRTGRKMLRGSSSSILRSSGSSGARRLAQSYTLVGSDNTDMTYTPGASPAPADTETETNVTANTTSPMMVSTPDLGPVMVEYAINVTMNDTMMTQLGIINATTGNTTVEFAEPEEVLFMNFTMANATDNTTTGNDTVEFRRSTSGW
jgi:hypothetical protein